MLEIYKTQVFTRFITRQSTATFYRQVENESGNSPHRIASAINYSDAVATNWLFYYSGIITEYCHIEKLATRRVFPLGGPTAYNVYWPGELVGRWVGQMGDNFTTVNIQWLTQWVGRGFHHSRIGPLGQGARQDYGWYPLFVLACQAFITEHLATVTLETSDEMKAVCAIPGFGYLPITQAQLMPETGRQRNRRWEP